jgi:TatD DNase family protein
MVDNRDSGVGCGIVKKGKKMKWIDFHTHQMPESGNGVNAIVSCVSPEPVPACREGSWLSYGIHPWYITGHDVFHLLEQVEVAVARPCVLAVGEAGLDKVRGPNMQLQLELFIHQMDISERHGKPMIIHSVRANNELLNLRKHLRASQPWVLHDFSGSPQEIDQLSAAGFYFSFGPRILYPNGNASASLLHVPAQRFFLETDHTNKSIVPLYSRAAEIREVSLYDIKQQVGDNFKALFKI